MFLLNDLRFFQARRLDKSNPVNIKYFSSILRCTDFFRICARVCRSLKIVRRITIVALAFFCVSGSVPASSVQTEVDGSTKTLIYIYGNASREIYESITLMAHSTVTQAAKLEVRMGKHGGWYAAYETNTVQQAIDFSQINYYPAGQIYGCGQYVIKDEYYCSKTVRPEVKEIPLLHFSVAGGGIYYFKLSQKGSRVFLKAVPESTGAKNLEKLTQ